MPVEQVSEQRALDYQAGELAGRKWMAGSPPQRENLRALAKKVGKFTDSRLDDVCNGSRYIYQHLTDDSKPTNEGYVKFWSEALGRNWLNNTKIPDTSDFYTGFIFGALGGLIEKEGKPDVVLPPIGKPFVRKSTATV
jgi:hypothetical protein